FKLSNLLDHPQIGLLLLESLSIVAHFALFHPENQQVLRWGKSPTILHKVRDLPFVFCILQRPRTDASVG
ncbi:hypothetical protein SDJN02_14242, partial [Cucurbita argyrosperma subsp. argyrosperma]